MLTYKAMFKFDEGGVFARVLDFPGAITSGADLAEARMMVAFELSDMAESPILDGDPLPLPNPDLTDPDADLEEPVYLLLTGANSVTEVASP